MKHAIYISSVRVVPPSRRVFDLPPWITPRLANPPPTLFTRPFLLSLHVLLGRSEMRERERNGVPSSFNFITASASYLPSFTPRRRRDTNSIAAGKLHSERTALRLGSASSTIAMLKRRTRLRGSRALTGSLTSESSSSMVITGIIRR